MAGWQPPKIGRSRSVSAPPDTATVSAVDPPMPRRVGVGAAGQQQLDDRRIAVGGGHGERREHPRGSVGIDPAVEQQSHRGGLALVDRMEERRPFVDPAAGIGIGAVVEQRRHRLDGAGPAAHISGVKP